MYECRRGFGHVRGCNTRVTSGLGRLQLSHSSPRGSKQPLNLLWLFTQSGLGVGDVASVGKFKFLILVG